MSYVELQCKSNFSFLEGASHAYELVEQAAELGLSGLAITDRNSLSGVVRAFTAARDISFPLIIGSELHPIDGPPLLLYATDRSSYGRLSRLITRGRMAADKGQFAITWDEIASSSEGLIAGFLPRKPSQDWLGSAVQHHSMLDRYQSDLRDDVTQRKIAIEQRNDGTWSWVQWLDRFREIFGDRGYLMASLHRGTDDREKLRRLLELSQRSNVPLVACGDVQYHVAERMLLHDALAAIALGKTIEDIREFRPANAQYCLRSAAAMQSLLAEYPMAIHRTMEIQSRCHFSLAELRYEYPIELAPDGTKPIDYLIQLTWEGAAKRYPQGLPSKIVAGIQHELSLIAELNYEAYFLTVWDLVRFARSQNILCQGRGSAANSIVCFCLGITSVDPNQMEVLFERFISRERGEAPDIDVDFEHQRREEVLQYIYEKYGRHRAGMTAAVTTYRIRSAVRDCGKALGISLDRIDALSKIVDGRHQEDSLADRCLSAGIQPESDIGKRFLYLVESLLGFPRHLSQHVGGMVMTQGPLCELCPLENASMQDRTVLQWDKDDLDELGILKVDCLALGMLSAIHRSFVLLDEKFDRQVELATLPPDDPAVYDMICRADTVGVFQIESRAQMSMLPRLRPRNYYDLVIEVAIVRPGPIQGNMVHPYLKARQSGIQPEYPNDAIRQVLSRTMGVPIFQEQAMRLAVVAAGFTPGEADQLRRAMAAWRRPGVIDQFKQKLILGMQSNGLDEKFAQHVFTQIRGFGEYGFPESHAASFALLVYASCWLKYYYPAVFCVSILNSLPMGFYGPSQLIQDAQRHGVVVRTADINQSEWETTLVPRVSTEQPLYQCEQVVESTGRYAIQLGLSMVRGLPSETIDLILTERNKNGPFVDTSQLVRRTRIGQSLLAKLADCGALGSLAGDRRAAVWQAMAHEKTPRSLPLFEAKGVDIDDAVPSTLKRMSSLEEVYADYETIGVSLKGHPIEFFRNELEAMRVTPSMQLRDLRSGQMVRVAGLVVLRQRPSTAKGITFVTLEDETGAVNLVIRPNTWKQFYMICKQSNAWLVHGVLETREDVTHVIVGRVQDLSVHLQGLDMRSRDFR